MTHHSQRLVLPSDLNHYGFLFGGRLLAWVDEASWIAASLDFPHCQFVTIGMDKVEFRHGVRDGTILGMQSEKIHTGRTSVSYKVCVFNEKESPSKCLFRTQVTFVSVNDSGEKKAI